MSRSITDAGQTATPGSKVQSEQSSPASDGLPKQRPAKRGRGRTWLLRLLSLALGLFLAFVLAELVVLVFVGEQPKFPRRVVAAPWGLRYNEPEARYRHKSADVNVRFRINAAGMRADRDYPYEKPPGVKRIICLGDSFTVGYEVDVEDCFASLVQQELNRAGMNVEVLNAGVSGFSTAEEYLYLKRELMKYGPDLVIISFFGNDPHDNVRTGLFRIRDDQLTPWRQQYVPLGRVGNFLNENWLFNLLSERSNVFVLVKERANLILKRSLIRDNMRSTKEAEKRGAGEASTPAADDSGNEPAEGADAPASPFAMRLTAAIYEQVYSELRQQGIPLIIQNIPTYRAHLDEKLADLFPYDLFETERPGLALLDANRVLRPYVDTHQLYFERSHFHWTPFSHEKSGAALAQLIRERRFLQGTVVPVGQGASRD